MTKNTRDGIIHRFKDKDGGEYWLDVNTFDENLLPTREQRVFYSPTGISAVEVSLNFDYDYDTDRIRLTASFFKQGSKVRVSSTPVEVKAEWFVQELYKSFKAEDTFENRQAIRAIIDEAMKNLAEIAFKNHSIIFQRFEIKGDGYISYDKDTIAIFDTIKFGTNYSLDTIVLDNLYCQFDIVAEKNPVICFKTKTNKITFRSLALTDQKTGSHENITNYFSSKNGPILIETIAHKNEMIPFPEEGWYEQRKDIIDSFNESDTSIDDRFDDLF